MICLSAALGLCWYPLSKLESMQMETSQLLFFAFSSGALITSPFMAFQVKKWRTKTLELLIFGLVGGVSVAILHYSLLDDFPIAALSLFAMSAVGSLFYDRLKKSEPIGIGEFMTMLSLLLAALLIVLSMDGLKFDWTKVLAVFSGIGFYRLILLNEGSSTSIPIISRVAAVFIASTWLVGMMLIFSPRSNNFPLENAAFFSALYGVVILLPIIFSIVFVLIKNQFSTLLFWITLMLAFTLLGAIAYSNVTSLNVMIWVSLLLILGCGVKLMFGKEGLLRET